MTKRHSASEEQFFRNLKQDLHDVVRNESVLKKSLNNFLNNLVDELTLGIIFDLHRKYKTDSYDWSVDVPREATSMEKPAKERTRIYDGGAVPTLDCPVCKMKASGPFSEHLAVCMGIEKPKRAMPDRGTRNSSRQQVSDCPGKSSYLHSDDEAMEDAKNSNEDPDWEKEKKKTKKTRNNKPKGKNKFSPKKPPKRMEDDDALVHFTHFNLEDSNNSNNSTSPTNSESGKKKNKPKSQKKNS